MKKISIWFLGSLFLYNSINLCAQTISTIVGNHKAGFSGNGGVATLAELSGPGDVVVDSAGNMFIAESGNSIVRKVNSNGIISTFAGIPGAFGYSGDNGPATSAELDEPSGVALDDSGNVYIADPTFNIIRKVNAFTGTITTVAGHSSSPGGYGGDGGQATVASLDDPLSVAIGDSGNIYIADYHNNVIRKVTVATGIINTIAGNGYGHQVSTMWFGGYNGDGGPAIAAEMYGPAYVTFDDSVNMYVADALNNVIRKVTKLTGIISTDAGSGSRGGTGNGGPATAAKLWSPSGIAIDYTGNIYISDLTNAMRKVTKSTGIISTFAGNGIAGYYGDGGPATSAEVYDPAGMKFDASGNLFIADQENNVIRKITYNTTGINEIKQTNEVSVYPNPSNTQVTIETAGNIGNQNVIDIYDMLGQKVQSVGLTGKKTTINISSLSQGVYFYRISSSLGKLWSSGKLVIVH